MHERFSLNSRFRRFSLRSLAASVLAAVVLAASIGQVAPAEAQVRILDASSSTKVESFLERGVSLEKKRRWGEALSHYEDALKEVPGEQRLRQRADWARIHYDLSRRYADASFRRSVTTLSAAEALKLYREVLLKIDTHFVRTTSWQDLVQRGGRSVDVAVRDETFVEQNLRGMPSSRVEAAVQQFHNTVDRYRVSNRQEAASVAAIAAQTLQRELGLRPASVIMEYVSGAIGGLDTYSNYLTSDQLKDVYSQIDGNFVGLGIELKADNRSLLIVSVIPGSPADRGGIRAGDQILEVDGQATTDVTTEKAAALLQGPEHSVADLVVATADQASRRLRIRREHVDVPSIDDVKMLDRANGIAYMKMVSFQRGTGRDLESALWKLYHQGMRSLIVDVRGNPGGLLSAAVDVADKFVSEGRIVSTRGRSEQEDYDYTARRSNTWRVPLVVLIDEDSASASEIFAAAIRDHRRGTIVGTRSYGKGSVQGIFPLAQAGSGLRLTTAKFYSPSGQPISNVGVAPHVQIRETAKPGLTAAGPAADQDAVLQAAIRAASQQMAQR